MGEAGALAGTVEDEVGYAEQVTTDAATGLVDDSSRTGLQGIKLLLSTCLNRWRRWIKLP